MAKLRKALLGYPIPNPQPVRKGMWTEPHHSFDYTDLLDGYDPQLRRDGYSIAVKHPQKMRPGALIQAQLHHRGVNVGGVTGFFKAPASLHIAAANVPPPHDGRKMGTACYEAVMAHAANNLGCTEVYGDTHSDAARAVHTNLANKHGMEYQSSRVDDGRNGPYQYTIKSEDFHAVANLVADFTPLVKEEDENDEILRLLKSKTVEDRTLAFTAHGANMTEKHLKVALKDRSRTVLQKLVQHPLFTNDFFLAYATDPFVKKAADYLVQSYNSYEPDHQGTIERIWDGLHSKRKGAIAADRIETYRKLASMKNASPRVLDGMADASELMPLKKGRIKLDDLQRILRFVIENPNTGTSTLVRVLDAKKNASSQYQALRDQRPGMYTDERWTWDAANKEKLGELRSNADLYESVAPKILSHPNCPPEMVQEWAQPEKMDEDESLHRAALANPQLGSEKVVQLLDTYMERMRRNESDYNARYCMDSLTSNPAFPKEKMLAIIRDTSQEYVSRRLRNSILQSQRLKADPQLLVAGIEVGSSSASEIVRRDPRLPAGFWNAWIDSALTREDSDSRLQQIATNMNNRTRYMFNYGYTDADHPSEADIRRLADVSKERLGHIPTELLKLKNTPSSMADEFALSVLDPVAANNTSPDAWQSGVNAGRLSPDSFDKLIAKAPWRFLNDWISDSASERVRPEHINTLLQRATEDGTWAEAIYNSVASLPNLTPAQMTTIFKNSTGDAIGNLLGYGNVNLPNLPQDLVKNFLVNGSPENVSSDKWKAIRRNLVGSNGHPFVNDQLLKDLYETSPDDHDLSELIAQKTRDPDLKARIVESYPSNVYNDLHRAVMQSNPSGAALDGLVDRFIAAYSSEQGHRDAISSYGGHFANDSDYLMMNPHLNAEHIEKLINATDHHNFGVGVPDEQRDALKAAGKMHPNLAWILQQRISNHAGVPDSWLDRAIAKVQAAKADPTLRNNWGYSQSQFEANVKRALSRNRPDSVYKGQVQVRLGTSKLRMARQLIEDSGKNGLTVQELQKLLPGNWEPARVVEIKPGGRQIKTNMVTMDSINKLIEAVKPRTFNFDYRDWDDYLQNHITADGPERRQHVLQINPNNETVRKMKLAGAGVIPAFARIKQEHSLHPLDDLSLGWVRFNADNDKGTFDPAQSYNVNDVVTDGQNVYRRHTPEPTEWYRGNAYKRGDVVHDGATGLVYRALAHTSDPLRTATSWQKLGTMTQWQDPSLNNALRWELLGPRTDQFNPVGANIHEPEPFPNRSVHVSEVQSDHRTPHTTWTLAQNRLHTPEPPTAPAYPVVGKDYDNNVEEGPITPEQHAEWEKETARFKYPELPKGMYGPISPQEHEQYQLGIKTKMDEYKARLKDHALNAEPVWRNANRECNEGMHKRGIYIFTEDPSDEEIKDWSPETYFRNKITGEIISEKERLDHPEHQPRKLDPFYAAVDPAEGHLVPSHWESGVKLKSTGKFFNLAPKTHPHEILQNSMEQWLRDRGQKKLRIHFPTLPWRGLLSGLRGFATFDWYRRSQRKANNEPEPNPRDLSPPIHYVHTYEKMPPAEGYKLDAEYGDEAHERGEEKFKGLPMWSRLVLHEKPLHKAIDDIPPGPYNERTRRFDYSHLLTRPTGDPVEDEKRRALKEQGYTVRLWVDHPYGSDEPIMSAAASVPAKSGHGTVWVGSVTGKVGPHYLIEGDPRTRKDLFIDLADIHDGIDEDSDGINHTGKGLGTVLYEALMAHGKKHLKVTHVAGSPHSTMAAGVHSKLARLHGLGYKAVPNFPSHKYPTAEEWQATKPHGYDTKYRGAPRSDMDEGAGYRYTLKSEPLPLTEVLAKARKQTLASIPITKPKEGLPSHEKKLYYGSTLKITRYNYSHLLPKEARAAGYRIWVYRTPGGTPKEPRLIARLFHKNRRAGFVMGALFQPRDGTKRYYNVEESHLNNDHRKTNRSKEAQAWPLGKLLYVAAYAHAKNAEGATHVSGSAHSSLASLAHRSIARDYGLRYEALPNVTGGPGDDAPNSSVDQYGEIVNPRPYDEAFDGYEYTLR